MKRNFVLLFILLAFPLSASLNGKAASSSQPLPAPTPTPTSTQPPVLKKSDAATSNRQPPPAPTAESVEPEEISDEGTVRVSTSLVTVPVSIMDRDGRYVADMKREEFRIYEDGSEQELAFFASSEKPFTVVLMIDASDSAIFRLDEVKDAAIAFVDQLRPDDRAIVVAFDRVVTVLAPATNDKETLRQAIQRAEVGAGTSLYNAVDMTLKQILNSIEGRKAVMLFTDGVDTSSMGASFDRTLRDASESDTLIYTVQYDLSPAGKRYLNLSMRGGWSQIGMVGRTQRIIADKYLSLLALKTGGRHYLAKTIESLRKAFADIADELRHQYSLGYYPKASAPSVQPRRIRVRVTRTKLVVRSRTSYVSNLPENVAPDTEP
jgi:VWFA-related protein